MNNTEILASVSRAVNDATFTKRSKAIMLGILTDTQNYIVEQTECLRKIDSTSVTLVAGTSTYSLPSNFIKFPTNHVDVKRGFISLGTYGRYPLTVISQAVLNNQYPGWRQTAAGTPEFYAVTEEGTPQLIIYPKPSAAFITAAGSVAFIDMIYRPADIVEDTNLPFDNGPRFNGLFQRLLKLSAIWQIKLEDMQFNDENRLDKQVDMLMEKALDFAQSFAPTVGHHGFEEELS